MSEHPPKCVLRQCTLSEDEAERYACLRCTESIRRHVRAIETYTQMLPLLLLPGRGDSGRRSPGFRSTPPLSLDALDALDTRVDAEFDEDSRPILWRLDSLCRLVLEERFDAGDAEEFELHTATLGGMITYLLRHTDWCAHQPWVDDFASNVAELHGHVRAKAGDAPPRALAPCLSVGCEGQVHWSRDVSDGRGGTLDAARCRSCHRTYTGMDLVRLRAQEAS